MKRRGGEKEQEEANCEEREESCSKREPEDPLQVDNLQRLSQG